VLGGSAWHLTGVGVTCQKFWQSHSLSPDIHGWGGERHRGASVCRPGFPTEVEEVLVKGVYQVFVIACFF